MPRGVRTTTSKASIDTRRAELEAELASLREAELKLNEARVDAGREVLLAAFGRIKIGAMSKRSARVIAKAIGSEGGDAFADRIGTGNEVEGTE